MAPQCVVILLNWSGCFQLMMISHNILFLSEWMCLFFKAESLHNGRESALSSHRATFLTWLHTSSPLTHSHLVHLPLRVMDPKQALEFFSFTAGALHHINLSTFTLQCVK